MTLTPSRCVCTQPPGSRHGSTVLVGGQMGDVSKAVGAEWKALPEDDKAKFNAEAKREKSKYDTDRAEYDSAMSVLPGYVERIALSKPKRVRKSASGDADGDSAVSKKKKGRRIRITEEDLVLAPKPAPAETAERLFKTERLSQIKLESVDMTRSQMSDAVKASWNTIDEATKAKVRSSRHSRHAAPVHVRDALLIVDTPGRHHRSATTTDRHHDEPPSVALLRCCLSQYDAMATAEDERYERELAEWTERTGLHLAAARLSACVQGAAVKPEKRERDDDDSNSDGESGSSSEEDEEPPPKKVKPPRLKLQREELKEALLAAGWAITTENFNTTFIEKDPRTGLRKYFPSLNAAVKACEKKWRKYAAKAATAANDEDEESGDEATEPYAKLLSLFEWIV